MSLIGLQNNRIERFWVEVNQRVGYPIKAALIEMEQTGMMERENEAHLFAMSQVGMWIARSIRFNYGSENLEQSRCQR